MSKVDVPQLLLSLSAGIFSGAALMWARYRWRLGGLRGLGKQIIDAAESEAQKLRKETEAACQHQLVEREHEWSARVQKQEKTLQQRSERLDLFELKLSNQRKELEKREASCADLEAQQARREMLLRKELETLAGASSDQARKQVLEEARLDVKREATALIRKRRSEAEDEAQQAARRILATCLSRLAVETVAQVTVVAVPLPDDKLKGRIIGREGRNIRAFERATGVNLVIDDTPSTVVISGFDPVRKEVARRALVELAQDGRIHPTRIEEAVKNAQLNVENNIRVAGEDAALRAGIPDLHPELIKLLGRLRYRHSYAQNVLEHSLEVSALLGLMCEEIGLNAALGRRIGLLHDVGKAMTHEVRGTHALIGANLASKYGESEAVSNGIACHHGEVEPITLEGSLCGCADALSASRPGARIEEVESYVRRLQEMETLSKTFPGVAEVHALQAGRELCVLVRPDMVDDDGMFILARDIARKIEEQLSYPGKIQVTVLREQRAVAYAL